MLLRRVIVVVGVFLNVPLASISPAMADRISSGEMNQDFLDTCDDRAMPIDAYDRKIAAAAGELTAMGIFEETAFHDVKIGFCELRSVQGPVATTSCARDTILLDSGYAAKDQSIVLNATLAHEMKHYFQHRKQKAEFGEGYCFSDRYVADKTWMEEEADVFGDSVGELFFVGRQVEIRNECSVAVSVYLEADSPLSTIGDFPNFIDVAPQSTALASERSVSNLFKYYAESKPSQGRQWIWRARGSAHERIINGKRYSLQSVTLTNATQSTGSFQLSLSCKLDQEADQALIGHQGHLRFVQ